MFAPIIAAALALPFVVQTALAADCTRFYTVQAGDTCDSISAAKNASTYQVAVVNIGTINPECSNLAIGSSICLGHKDTDCSTTYTVVKDDTCEGVANKVGVTLDILYGNNPQLNKECSNLYINEVLCSGKTINVPAAPAGTTPAATIPATATPAAPSPTNNAADGDPNDDDLPFCDEL